MSAFDGDHLDRVGATHALRAATDIDLRAAIRRGNEASIFRSRPLTVAFGGALPVIFCLAKGSVWVVALTFVGLVALAMAEQRRFTRAAGVRISPRRRASLLRNRTPEQTRRARRISIISTVVCGVGGIAVSELDIDPPLWLGVAAAPFCALWSGRAWDRGQWRREGAA